MSLQNQNDDFFLIKRYRNGDKAALDSLIKRYQGRLYNVILKMCSNPDDAMELTQDSFVKVIENVDSFEGKSTFYTYLFRVGVNLAINFCNRRKIVRFTALDGGDADVQGSAALMDYFQSDSEPDPADVLMNKEAVGLLRSALGSLDEKYRTIIVLRDIEDMSYEQISEILELESGTVKSRLFRARMLLKEKLMPFCDEEK